MADLAGGLLPSTFNEAAPDSRWNASEVPGGLMIFDDNPDSRWTASAAYPIGSSTPTLYLMRALATSDSQPVFWQASGSPDLTGALAPVSVQVSTIVTVRKLS